MQSERWKSCTDLFHAALERAPHERATFIARSCADDPALRKQVELLLRYHEEAGEFIASPAFAAAPELLTDDPGTRIGQHLGPYRIDAVLGVGGMGVVYLACDERLGRKVGLKLLPRVLVNDEAQLERLKFEARTASALNHPNIVTVHEIGQVESTHYIAIEFIEGITLRERIRRGPVPPDEALEIATQVGSALCVAHRAGIVHRDIKPENIMIRPDGYVKVLDFGIAKSTLGEAAGEAAAYLARKTNTQLGMVLGTTQYMSPEQARGETVDARGDLWSLGVVLYEMLSGGTPFDADTPTEIKHAVLRRDPPPLRLEQFHAAGASSSALHEIVKKCLRKNPGERFQSAEDLLAALRDCRGDTVFVAWRRKGRRKQRKIERKKILLGVAVAALLVAIGAFAILPRFSPRRAAFPADANTPTVAGGTTNFVFTKPTGVAVDANGVIYVADFPNHTIRTVTPGGGGMKDFAGARGVAGHADGARAAARFSNPADVAVGPDGVIYVADCDNHAIRKITPTGEVSTLAGGPQQSGHKDGPAAVAKFKFPTGVAVDGAGNVYVADIANHVVRKITPDGTASTLAGTPGEIGSADGVGAEARFNEVHGVAADRVGNVYAADFGNHAIRKITPAGVVTTIAGKAGSPGKEDGAGTAARLCAPYSVAADDAGSVFIADTSNHTIRRITPAGVVQTLAGVPGNVGNADGDPSVARFAIPARVALDNAGNVYVADFGNHAVRKITPAGVVSTLAGLGGSDARGGDDSKPPTESRISR